jgi:endoglucanase
MRNFNRFIHWFLFAVLFMPQSCLSQGFLKVSGKHIVDHKGHEFIMRGMGLGGWMLQEPYMLQLSGSVMNQGDLRKKMSALIGAKNTAAFYEAWLKNHCTKADVDSMKAWGFNSIRLPMHYNLYTLSSEEEPVKDKQTWLQKGFDMTDSLLSWCKSNEMYLILDLHAAPGGQGTDFAISDRDTTKASLWQSVDNQQKTIQLWRKLAERYAAEKWIGGYDLINETNWGFQNSNDKNGCAETANGLLRKLLMEITTAIRQVDSHHIIFIEGNCWANNYKGIFPLWDKNIVISFHKYWNENTQASIQQFIDIREEQNAPIWMGESGENSNVWFRSAIELLEKNKIGWTWWPLKKMGINNPLQVPTNQAYQKLIAYWKGEEEKPTADDAFKGLMQLAEDTRINKNSYHKDVVDAMFRQVIDKQTIPFITHDLSKKTILYAVNYDMGKNGEAYYTNDSANYWVTSGKRTQWNKGWAYRNDGVDIETCIDTITNGYSVSSITKEEWLQYSIENDAKESYTINLRIAAKEPAALHIFLNNQKVVGDYSITSTNGSWKTISLKNIELKKGINSLRIANAGGEFSLNYLQFSGGSNSAKNSKINY